MKLADWLFYSLAAFVVGVFLRSFFDFPWLFFINLSFISLAVFTLIFILDRQALKFFLGIAFISVFAGLGILRTEAKLFAKDELQIFRDTEEVVKISGVIRGQRDLRENHIKYILLTQPLNEKILVSTELSQKFNPGDKILIQGTLQTPKEFPDFNYREFLSKDGIRTVAYYPEIEILQKSGFNFYNAILQIKEKLRQANRRALPFPESELLGAMVLGDKQLLPDYLKESFNTTGIRHITAISGMHITIIASLLMAFFAYGTKLGKDRGFYLVLFFLIFYIALVGFPPSAVRAGIMASIVLLAEKVRRNYFAPRALVLAAFAMLLFNPALLRFDAGFQLSFLAVLGIIYIAPLFNLILEKISVLKNKKLVWLKKVLSMTLGAQISTLPILVYNFGLFSLSAPVVNVLVVPLLPFVIGFGFIGILAGLVSQAVGVVFSFPAFLLLSYIISLSQFFDNFKWSGIKVENFHWSLVIVFYVFLITTVVFLRNKYLKQINSETL